MGTDCIFCQMTRHDIPCDIIDSNDEFIVLIENVGMERALKIEEKIRSKIYEAKSVDNVRCPDLKVSISIGVAIGASRWLPLLEHTYRALFQDKEQGKNKVAS